ncbi:hypothetical protein GW17_00061962 [Ensete ventricosum]|nr:hypothetical protein GW17_00061962 [Ensete ventricosum]
MLADGGAADLVEDGSECCSFPTFGRTVGSSNSRVETAVVAEEGVASDESGWCWETLAGRLYIPVFQIRVEKMKEVRRPPL